MAIKVPEQADLDAIKAAIPNPGEFPLPKPEEVNRNYNEWDAKYPLLGSRVSPYTVQFLTGVKFRGKGTALASYPTLYQNAIIPLQNMWDIRDNPDDVSDYLLKHPIFYKLDKAPTDARYSDGSINQTEYISRCFTNLFEWIYLPSNPVYQYLREHLLEKARKVRDIYRNASYNNRSSVGALPQRTTTSRSLGSDELTLHRVNGGYRVIDNEDPFTGEITQMLELITWFFSGAGTTSNFYVDYFDVENGDVEKAVRKLRQSHLYRKWAADLNPQQYDAQCANFRIDSALAKDELAELTPLD